MSRWLTLTSRVILVLAALVVIAFGLLVAREVLRDTLRDRGRPDIALTDTPDADLHDVLRYAAPTVTPGGNLSFPLQIERLYRDSSYGKSARNSTVNYLIMNEDDSTRWLFDGHRQLVLTDRRFYRPLDADEESRNLVAVLLEVVTSDTSGDGRLSHEDRRALMLVSAEFEAPVVLLEGYSDLDPPKDLDDDHLRFFAKLDGRQALYDLSLSDRALTRIRVLPPPVEQN